MAKYALTIDIAAPRDFLFDLWTDPERMADWTQGLTRVTDVTGVIGETGSRFRAWYGTLDEKIEVVASERPFYVRRRSTFGGIKVETAMALEATDGGTRVRQSWTARGIKSRVWARLLAIGTYRWSFRAELNRFAQVAAREFHDARPSRQPVPGMAPDLAALPNPVETPPPIRA
jgi:hypothetical protein